MEKIEKAGYSTIQASDGLAALRILEDNVDIDCVLTDCQMPNLDGPGLISRIREKDITIPIIVYSEYLTIRELEDLISHGATCFLDTPISLHVLHTQLHRVIG